MVGALAVTRRLSFSEYGQKLLKDVLLFSCALYPELTVDLLSWAQDRSREKNEPRFLQTVLGMGQGPRPCFRSRMHPDPFENGLGTLRAPPDT